MLDGVIVCASVVAAFLAYDRLRQTSGIGWITVWMAVLIVLPAWFFFNLRSIEISPRMAVGLTVLLWVLFARQERVRPRIYALDFAMVALVGYMLFTDFVAQTVVPLGVVNLILRWFLPYFLGRIFLSSFNDVGQVLKVVCIAAPCLSALGFIEGVIQFNPIDLVFSKDHEYDASIRFGLKRANGNYGHPIYFGVAMAMMLPWLLEAARWARAQRGPGWWVFTPWAMLPGIIATGSRSAQIMAIAIVVVDLFYHLKWLRVPMIVMAALGAIIFVAYRAEIVDLLSAYVGEKNPQSELVKINGEPTEYSGTRHRDLLYVVYDEALKKLDTFGYGSQMKDMPQDPVMDPRFKSIDNHYLLFMLQHGPLGMVFFAAVAALGVIQFFPLIRSTQPIGGLATGIVGSVAAFLLILRGVWLTAELLTLWLFYIGLGAHWNSLLKQIEANEGVGNLPS